MATMAYSVPCVLIQSRLIYASPSSANFDKLPLVQTLSLALSLLLGKEIGFHHHLISLAAGSLPCGLQTIAIH